MIYLLIKVCINKALIHIKSNNRTLKISYHNGKVGVYLCGGAGFESCSMHVKNILIYYLFIYLYVSKIGYIILRLSRSVRNTLRQCAEYALQIQDGRL